MKTSGALRQVPEGRSCAKRDGAGDGLASRHHIAGLCTLKRSSCQQLVVSRSYVPLSERDSSLSAQGTWSGSSRTSYVTDAAARCILPSPGVLYSAQSLT